MFTYILFNKPYGVLSQFTDEGTGHPTLKQYIDVPLIVGGGIRTKEQALAAASAGADIIVTGNVIESTGGKQKVSEIIDGVKGNKS